MDTRSPTEWILCDELWLKILLLLSLSDLAAVSLVSRHFKALAYDDSLIINKFPLLTKDFLHIKKTSARNLMEKYHNQWGSFFKLPGNNFINCLLTQTPSNIESTVKAQSHRPLLIGLNDINHIGFKIGNIKEKEKIRIKHESSRLTWGPNGYPLHQLIELTDSVLQNSLGIKTLKYITFFTDEADDAIKWLMQYQSKFSIQPLIFIITFNKELAKLINQSSALPIFEVIEFDSQRERGFFWQDFVDHLSKVTNTKITPPDYSEFSPINTYTSRGCVLS